MEHRITEKDSLDRGLVPVLGETFEAGKPEGKELGRWRQKLESREEKLKYLRSGERYWFSPEGFGSEKRKNPA